MTNRLILLDGHALLFRAFHAMPDFRTPEGYPSGAVYGFTSVLIRILKELEPRWVITCFDAPGPTFRDELYPAYKGTRAETPNDLILQEPMVRTVLESFGIPHYAQSGWEADDLLGTLTEQAVQRTGHESVHEVIIATGDRDLLQLSGPKVKIYLLRQSIKEIELLDEAKVAGLIGVPARELLQWKALRGDPSDNILGVPGVGDKTALGFIQRYHSLEKLYAAVEKSDPLVTDRMKKLLLEFRDRAFANRDLLTIRKDAPIALDLAAAARSTYNPQRTGALLSSYGFKTILSRLPGYNPAEAAGQSTLF